MNIKPILLVEDNPDDVELSLRAFRKANIVNEVIVARDGAEALDYVLGTGEYAGRDATVGPAVILLDLKLPKVDGIEVLRRVRANEPTRFTPVVILTSSREERDIAAGYRMGCHSYIRKPVNFVDFADAVKQIGLYWLILNEPVPK